MSKSVWDNYFWIPFRNDSSEDIPAYGSMSITGVVSGGARVTLTCNKPSCDSTIYATNGPFKVAANTFGSACISAHRVAKYTGTLSPGDSCKPRTEEWVIEEDTTGQFMCIGVINETDKLALISLLPKVIACDSSDMSGSSSACNTIPGVDLDMVDVASASEVDYVLAIKNGCLVKVALSQCDQSGSV